VTDSQVAVAVQAVDERRAQAVSALEQLLRAMDVPATLETRDLPDGSISIAVMPGVELAGIVPGRRSPLGDALQYLVNKLVNKPGQERRWVAVGVGGHPEPRGPKPARPQPAPAPASAMTNGSGAPAPTPASRAPVAARPAAPVRASETDERTLLGEEDPALDAAARGLAERSARSGRIYAVVALGATERGRLLRAADGVDGVSAHAEGDGRLRRVVLTPEKMVPMPKQRLPVDDLPDDDD
jgi:predicted RNA-binding protein Jag